MVDLISDGSGACKHGGNRDTYRECDCAGCWSIAAVLGKKLDPESEFPIGAGVGFDRFRCLLYQPCDFVSQKKIVKPSRLFLYYEG